MKTPREDQYSEKEAAARRDEIIKRMIATPPKPHSEMKISKKKPHRAGKMILPTPQERPKRKP